MMDGSRSAVIGAIGLPVRRLHVELTNKCNFSCEFCPDGKMRRPRGSMPLSAVERILAQAGPGGIARQVHFHVMGEPLLYPDLPGAVRIARRYGMEAWVTTNGSLLSRGVLEELQEAGLSHLTISLQTPDAPTFAFRGSRAASFEEYRDRIVDTVRAFLSRGEGMRLSVGFFSTPLRRFLVPDSPDIRVADTGRKLRDHLGRWVELIFRGTPLEKEIPRILARTRRAGILKENVIPISERVDFRVRILGNWAGHFDQPVRPARFGYCPGLSEHFGILWNGDYVICCADFNGKTVLANSSETPLREYLSLPEVQDIARNFRRYRVVHPYCQRCLGDRRLVLSFLRQCGSILYFRGYRRLFPPS